MLRLKLRTKTRSLLIAGFVTITLTACGADAAPSSIEAAKAFLGSTKTEDGMIEGRQWERGIVLRTHYTSDAVDVDNRWSMEVLKPDGSTFQVYSGDAAVVANLNARILPGDYVVYDAGSDAKVLEDEVRIIRKGAVKIG